MNLCDHQRVLHDPWTALPRRGSIFRLLLYILAAGLFTGPGIALADDGSCYTDTVRIRTGWNDATNTVYGTGTTNAYWSVVGTPAQPYPTLPPFPAWNIAPAGGWVTYANTRWMSFQNSSTNNTVGRYSFQMTFCLPSLSGLPAPLRLVLDTRVDDSAAFYINNNYVGSARFTVSGNINHIDISIPNSFLVSGNNQLRMDVINTFATQMGVDVDGYITTTNKQFLVKPSCCNCFTDSLNLSTAWNVGTNSVQATGTVSTQWWVISTPTGPVTPFLARNIAAGSGWSAPLPNTQYMSNLTTAVNNTIGQYRFQDTFCLPTGFKTFKPKITVVCRVDDTARFYLNGTLIGTAVGFGTTPTTITTDISNMVKSGRNVLEIEVINAFVTQMGVDASIRIWADGLLVRKQTCCDYGCDTVQYTATPDSTCCTYCFLLRNLTGSNVTQIAYSIIGGTLESFTHSSPCTQVAPVPGFGSTNGTMNFSPSCAGDIPLCIAVNPTTASGVVTVQFRVRHANGALCIFSLRFNCVRPPKKCPDKITTTPYVVDAGSSGMNFRIDNTKSPKSPIVKVLINPVPPATPGYQFVGSGLKVDGKLTGWVLPDNPFVIQNISANNTVQFGLQIQYAANWVGRINITVIFEDGDTCTYSIPWDARLKGNGPVKVIEDTPTRRAVPLMLRVVADTADTNTIGFLSVHTVGVTDVIMGGTGATIEGGPILPELLNVKLFEQGRRSALFTFSDAMVLDSADTSKGVVIVIGKDTADTSDPIIIWTLYDTNGVAITSDTTSAHGGGPTGGGGRTIRSNVDGGWGAIDQVRGFDLLEAIPNPARDMVTLNYLLGRAADVRLELYDARGARVATVEEGRKETGPHAMQFGTSRLPSGTYYVRLTVDGQTKTSSLVIGR